VAPGDPSGAYAIEEPDPERDRDELLRLLTGSLPGFGEARFAKYYERNPCGRPVVRVARRDGAIVGSAALHPVEVVVEGEVVPAAVAGDFAVAPAHRVFGPALALQRAVLEGGRSRGFRFVYALPNVEAGGVLARVGYGELAPLVRHVRVLSLREAVVAWRDGSLRSAGMLLRTLAPVPGPRGYSVGNAASFDGSFAAVWEAMHARAAVVPRQTAAVCAWKYAGYETTTVSRADNVEAYSVSCVGDGVRHVVDLGFVDERALRAILAAELRRGRRDGLAALDLQLVGRVPVLPELGFAAFPGPSLRIQTYPDGPPVVREPRSWLAFEGAIDL
jgi:hypothetical protein